MKTTQESNNFRATCKTLKHIIGTFLTVTLLLTSCSKNNDDGDNNDIIIRPTAEDFNALQDAALENATQNFQFNTSDPSVTLTSEKGVVININTSCLTLNGSAITGNVDLEFIELFDKGSMLTTNKPTMGTMPNGDKALLISGGEFFVNATQNGEALETTCGFQMTIPTNLTGDPDNEMILWNGRIDDNGDLVWDEEERDDTGAQGGNVFAEGNNYYGFFQSFGWSNVDRFYNDPRPKTTLQATIPEGYNNTNSAIYLSYDGENTGLAQLDTYNPDTGIFSEHYGQIPVGLECHAIFATEDGDNWKYAIKPVTIIENGIITFTEDDMAIVTEAQLTIIINDLP